MKKHIGLITLAALVVAVFVSYTVAYPVRSTDLVFVTTGGKVDVDKVYDGRDPDETGLKFKWPFPVQAVTRYDARIFMFEDAGTTLSTKDGRQIILTMFCAWRITDPIAFAGDIETVADAQKTIGRSLVDKKSSVVGSRDFAEFINTDPEAMKLPEIEQEIQQALQAEVQQQYGIEIVMVGIKSLALPEETTASVIEAMKAEKQKEVTELQTTGTAYADTIRSRADVASQRILAFANRRAAEIEAEGYSEAVLLYEKFAEDPAFAMYLRELESLETGLSSNAVFMLDGSKIPAVGWFFDGPSVPAIDQDD